MKTSTFLVNLIVILFFNSITLNIVSQPYKSIFGKQSTQWNIYEDFISPWSCVQIADKDTVINSVLYKKIIIPDTCDGRCFMISGGYKEFYLREDTMSGKVWSCNKVQTREKLVIDLSLDIGDTFKINPHAWWLSDTLAIVDSVYIENNIKKIRFNIKNEYDVDENLTFIEGIGANFGNEYQLNSNAVILTYLLCSYKDATIAYKHNNNWLNGMPNPCYFYPYGIGININQANNVNILIAPNPSSDYINIIFSRKVNGLIVIYDYIGIQKVITNIENSDKIQLNAYEWPSGIYFAKFFENNRFDNLSVKFIKY